MKNIIDIMKNIILNNKGAATQNVMRGLSVAVFASVIGYGVYTAYDNSPAYNPARRALFVADNQNLSVNSLDSGSISLQTSDGIPEGMQTLHGEFGKGHSGGTIQDRINQNEADFANARAYLNGQMGGEGGVPAETGMSIPSAQRRQVTQWGQSGQDLMPEALQTSQPAPVRNIETEISPNLTNAVRSQAGQNPNPALTAKGGPSGSTSVDGVAPTGNVAGAARGAGQAIGQAAGGQGEQGGEPSKGGKKGVRNALSKKPVTVINKMAGSGGANTKAGSVGGASAGGSFSGGASVGSSRGSQEGVGQPLPAAAPVNTKGGNAFKSGRNSVMGGYSVARGTGGIEAQGDRGGDKGTKSDLNRAYLRSGNARKSLRSPGGKDSAVAEAAAAFDGSDGSTGAEIGGDQIATGDTRNLHGLSDHSLDDSFNKLNNNTITDAQKQTRLEGAGLTHFLKALLTTIAACYVLLSLRKMADAGGPYSWAIWIAIAAVAAAALYAINFMDYDGNGKNIWADMGDLWTLNESLGNSQTGSWSFWLRPILAIFSAGVIASIFLGSKVSDAFTDWQKSWFGQRVGNLATVKVVADGKNAASGLINK